MLRFILILTVVVCLTGCKSGGGGSDSDSLSFSGADYSNDSGYTDNLGGTSNSGSGDDFGALDYSNDSGYTDSLGGTSNSGSGDDFVGLNPEPATLTLFGIGLGGLILSALKRKKNKNKE